MLFVLDTHLVFFECHISSIAVCVGWMSVIPSLYILWSNPSTPPPPPPIERKKKPSEQQISGEWMLCVGTIEHPLFRLTPLSSTHSTLGHQDLHTGVPELGTHGNKVRAGGAGGGSQSRQGGMGVCWWGVTDSKAFSCRVKRILQDKKWDGSCGYRHDEIWELTGLIWTCLPMTATFTDDVMGKFHLILQWVQIIRNLVLLFVISKFFFFLGERTNITSPPSQPPEFL